MVDKIKRNVVEDDAVTQPKIASGAVDNTALNKTAITGLTELSETAADNDLMLIYDTSNDSLKKISKSNTTNLDTPVVSNISPTSVLSNAGTTTFTITGTGFTAGTNARLIASTGKTINFDTVTRTSATSITATIDVATNLIEAETPYSVQVISGVGTAAVLSNQINIDQFPTFITGAGSLGSSRFTMAGVEVNAQDPDSAGNITFEKQSGSLPPGISLTNTSANGGTATFTGTITPQASDTTFNFVLRAVDAASNTSSRAFSFTALGPQIQSFTSSGTFAVPAGASSVDVLVVAGGGSGGGNANGGGGAGGLIFMPGYPVTQGTITVSVGEGGPAGGDSPNSRSVGQDSVFGAPSDPGIGQGGVLTAKGGGWASSKDGGSGAGAPFSSTAGAALQPTQPGNSGAYGFGNVGGNGNYTGASVGGGPYTGGGGGGAGAAGGNSTNSGSGGGNAGNGGAGKAYTIADGTTSVFYAGGAGGNTTAPSGSGSGGQGGGGQGGNEGGQNGSAGTANRGGGGGGRQNSPTGLANAGGKGVIIVKF